MELRSAAQHDTGCDWCNGDEALFWTDDKNSAFIDSRGEVTVTVNGKSLTFHVGYCPKCGRRFAN